MTNGATLHVIVREKPPENTIDTRFDGLTPTQGLSGCWLSTLVPIPWFWALHNNTPVGPDRLNFTKTQT